MTLAGLVASRLLGFGGIAAVCVACAGGCLTFFAFAASFRSSSAVLTCAGSLSGFCLAASLRRCGSGCRSFGNSYWSGFHRSLAYCWLIGALCRFDFISCSIYVLCMSGGNCTEDHGYEKQFLHGSWFVRCFTNLEIFLSFSQNALLPFRHRSSFRRVSQKSSRPAAGTGQCVSQSV
ncbi:MAG: hypothetical protein RLZZ370_61 [Bacteroidota bacterium]